jgi:decaprenylphospho-beta-D-ribofuranose 2-oxidase
MPVAEPTVRRLATEDDRERSLCGWGRIAPSSARVRRVTQAEDVVEALSGAGPGRAGLIARGAGRSYGDAAQSAGGRVLDMTGLDGIVSLDRERLTVSVRAGVTIARLLTHLGSIGLTLPVVPGTRYVTVGGAIASDVHGKSHHRDGSFGAHVRSIGLCVPGGEVLEISPQADRELFEATLGGMGLTGVILGATLDVEPLACAWVAADVDRTDDLEQTLALLSEHDRHHWSVAWLDLLAGGSHMGRALVSRADPWPGAPTGVHGHGIRARRHGGGFDLSEKPRVEVPPRIPSGALRPSLVRAFNAARWRRSPRRERGRRVALGGYLFPLDALGSWSRLYGPQGLVQYQLVVPGGQEAQLVRCVELLRARRLPVYLAVLKRFGAFPGGPLSFPIEGFTLALDLPGGAHGLRPALDELDEIVAGAGGRVYLSKDVRLRKDVLPTMYPQLDRFRAVRARVDPDGVLRSDLARRLGLCEGGG